MDMKEMIPDRGFIPAFVQYGLEDLQLPTRAEFLVGAVLGVLACALSKTVWTWYNSNKLTTNLYILLLGESGSGKSTATNFATKMLECINWEMVAKDIQLSDESTIALLSEAQDRTDGRIFFVANEFASLTKNMRKEYAGRIEEYLIHGYDCNSIRSKLQGSGDIRVTNPCVTTLACATPEKVLSRIKEGWLSGGFLPRFVFINCYESSCDIGTRPVSLAEPTGAKYVGAVNRLNEFITNSPVKIDFEPGAIKLHEEFILATRLEMRQSGDENYSTFLIRLPMICMKIAMIYSYTAHYDPIAKCSKGICHDNDMQEAINFCSFLLKPHLKQTLRGVSYTEYRENSNRALSYIETCYKRKVDVPFREFYRYLHVTPYKAKEILNGMHDEERVRVVVKSGDRKKYLVPWDTKLGEGWSNDGYYSTN